MKQRIRHIISNHFAAFIKYFCVGVSGVVLDIGSLYALKEYAGLTPVWAVALNQVFMINYVFILNRKWSFRSGGSAHREIVRFYALAGANYLFSVAWMSVVYGHFGVQYLVARIVNIAFAVLWNYFLYRFWVFHHTPPASASACI